MMVFLGGEQEEMGTPRRGQQASLRPSIPTMLAWAGADGFSCAALALRDDTQRWAVLGAPSSPHDHDRSYPEHTVHKLCASVETTHLK